MREEYYDYIINKPELNEDTLAHYGIKGMKWRKRKGSKNSKPFNKEKYVADHMADDVLSGRRIIGVTDSRRDRRTAGPAGKAGVHNFVKNWPDKLMTVTTKRIVKDSDGTRMKDGTKTEMTSKDQLYKSLGAAAKRKYKKK